MFNTIVVINGTLKLLNLVNVFKQTEICLSGQCVHWCRWDIHRITCFFCKQFSDQILWYAQNAQKMMSFSKLFHIITEIHFYRSIARIFFECMTYQHFYLMTTIKFYEFSLKYGYICQSLFSVFCFCFPACNRISSVSKICLKKNKSLYVLVPGSC